MKFDEFTLHHTQPRFQRVCHECLSELQWSESAGREIAECLECSEPRTRWLIWSVDKDMVVGEAEQDPSEEWYEGGEGATDA